MSCHYNELCQSPVTVTENRFYLNGEPWVLTREANLPIYVERQADLPKVPISRLEHASDQSSRERHQQSFLFDTLSQGENPSTKMELESPGACNNRLQRMSEPESPYPYHPQAGKASHETHTCVGTGSCKRLHLSHPHLCKKIVQKARRALSKLGRKPGSKACRNSTTPLAVSQHSTDFTSPREDANSHSAGPFELALSEQSAGESTAHELPAERAATDRAMVYEAHDECAVRHNPQETDFGYYADFVSPRTPFHRYSGSGSSISTWNQKPWQTPSSIPSTSNTDLPGLISPTRKLSELEGSSSCSSTFSLSTPPTNTSRILPVIGENALGTIGPTPAGTFDSAELVLSDSVAPESVVWQKQPLRDLFMGDWDLCPSPTSLLVPGGFSDRLIEADQIHELGPRHYDTYESTISEDAAIPTSSQHVAMHEYPCKRTSSFGTWSASDSDLFDNSPIAKPLCPCHGLPMRPDMDLSDLVAGAKSCGVSSHLLVQDDQRTLRGRIESMFTLLLQLAIQKIEGFDPEVLIVLAPAFKTLPTFQAGLKAVDDLHITQSLTHIHELVSLVFMAFSIAILTIDEGDLSQYIGVLYIDVASWTDALPTPADKQAFGKFLEILWLPQVRYPAASFQQREFCPFTIPKGLSTQDWRSSPLSNHVGLRSGMTVRLCLYYVDLIHHAAENEVASGFSSAEHVLDKDRPPLFVDSALADVVQPYLEQQVSDTMREVVSSTAQVLRNGELSSFNEVDAHLRLGVLNRPGHFGSESTCTSHVFSAMCQNAATMFAGRKLAWLMKTLQDSASRVVSQAWAEGVNTPEVATEEQDSGTAPNPGGLSADSQSRNASALTPDNHTITSTPPPPGLNKCMAGRRTTRQRKGSPDMVPSRCTQCARIFEGKWRRDHLRRHLKSVHSQHYITCELCGGKLKDRTDNVAKHMRACRPRHGD